MSTKEEISLYDKLQTRLSENGIIPNNFKFATVTLQDKTKGKMLMCPFCLIPHFLTEYTYNKGFYECKSCKNRITDKTLLKMYSFFTENEKIQTEEYARWVFDYRMNGFFQKITFKDFNERLKELNISYEFWDFYKKLKGEYKQDKENEDE